MRRQGKTGGAFGFALNFLWLLSLFQDKESDKQAIGRKKEPSADFSLFEMTKQEALG